MKSWQISLLTRFKWRLPHSLNTCPFWYAKLVVHASNPMTPLSAHFIEKKLKKDSLSHKSLTVSQDSFYTLTYSHLACWQMRWLSYLQICVNNEQKFHRQSGVRTRDTPTDKKRANRNDMFFLHRWWEKMESDNNNTTNDKRERSTYEASTPLSVTDSL